ncbi:hypothetical protein PR048_018592 [Dryococelus australis]|uniref:Tyrosine-protein phosphatase domain-containing protein n=1 Tax=Dryococelus australis TaxID=614101 RepID=A0ABQ9HCW1_9NEOP|nr:hypothetical protein PR048_018592 [Dryococelus australis]
MDTVYCDLTYNDLIKLVARNDFFEIVKQEHKQILSEKASGTFEDSANNINRRLNGYQNQVCYDQTRVILPLERNYGNYINANYVNGHEYNKKYICTQAPLEHTSYDFWRMVWMNHTCLIYWNDTEGGTVTFTKFTITTTKIEYYTGFVKTTLLLTHGTAASQEVTHFGFTQWPDFGTPSETQEFLNFMLAVRKNHEEIVKAVDFMSPKVPTTPNYHPLQRWSRTNRNLLRPRHSKFPNLMPLG